MANSFHDLTRVSLHEYSVLEFVFLHACCGHVSPKLTVRHDPYSLFFKHFSLLLFLLLRIFSCQIGLILQHPLFLHLLLLSSDLHATVEGKVARQLGAVQCLNDSFLKRRTTE